MHAPLVRPHAKGPGGGVGAETQAAGYTKGGGELPPIPRRALHYVLIERRAGVCSVATLERAFKVRAFVPLEIQRGFKGSPAFAGVRPCRGVTLPVLAQVAGIFCSVGTHGALKSAAGHCARKCRAVLGAQGAGRRKVFWWFFFCAEPFVGLLKKTVFLNRRIYPPCKE